MRRKSYQSCRILHGNHTGFRGEDIVLGGLEACSVARARILPAIASREMPRWLSQHCLFPFLLYKWTRDASLNSWGMLSWCSMILNSLVSYSFVMSFGPPFLKISPGMASAPGALPFRSLFVAFRTSSSLIVLMRVMLGIACGRRAMAASFIDEGRYRRSVQEMIQMTVGRKWLSAHCRSIWS